MLFFKFEYFSFPNNYFQNHLTANRNVPWPEGWMDAFASFEVDDDAGVAEKLLKESLSNCSNSKMKVKRDLKMFVSEFNLTKNTYQYPCWINGDAYSCPNVECSS